MSKLRKCGHGFTHQCHEFINLPDTKNRLVKNTQELMERGGFGSPTFFINDKDMYFGNDRLQLIENLL